MAIDFTAQARLADLRYRVLARLQDPSLPEVTADEYRLLIDDLRRGREPVVDTGSKKKKPTKKEPAPEQPRLDLQSLFKRSSDNG